MNKMNKKGKIIGLSLAVIMVVSLFAVAIPSITANNGDKPDLVITGIQVDGNRIRYTIANIGAADAPRSITGLWINGIYRASDMVGPLASGGVSGEVFARYNYRGGEMEVCADYQDRIEEENNGNNCRGGLPDLVIIEKHETEDADTCEFMVHFTVCNVGASDAGASVACVYVNGAQVDEVDVGPLAADECSDPIELGPYECTPCEILTIEVEADNNDDVEECNEDNNILENEFHCPAPDLEITDKFEEVDPGGCRFTVTYTVHNDGNCIAGPSETTIWIDGVDVMHDPVPVLAPCDSYTNVVGPFDCIPCEIVTIGVEADNFNAVEECDEENNLLENEFHCPAPDLEITDKFEEVDPEDCRFTVTYTVHNDGNCIAGPSETTIWIDGVDVMHDPVPVLAPCESYTNVVGPFDCIPCTTVTIVVEADNNDDVEECNEENNRLENEFHCPAPDLIITNKHETLDVATCTFTVTYTVKNVGNCKAGASTTTTTVDVVTDNFDTPALDPEEEIEHTTATGFNCVPGGVEVTVTADSADTVEECTEDNNEVTNTYYCCPDLIITEKEETVDVDACTFTVTYTVKNIGNCTAGPSTTTTSVGLVDDDFATPALDPEEEIEHTTATAFDCDPDGSVITVTADSADVVDECDETNNDLENEFLCCPDLIITEKEETVDVDTCTFTVTYTVKNVGNCKAGASTTTTTVDGVDDEFATPELDPEEEIEHTTATAFNCDPDGSDITVTADSAGVVDECDETNNEFWNEFLCCPDLIITEKEETVDVDTCTFTVTYTVKNIGNCKAGASTTTTTVDGVDDDYATPELDPGAEVEHTTATAFDCVLGGVDVTVTADSAGVVDECDETNNEMTNIAICLCEPDLVITDIWVEGNIERIHYTIKNIGGEPAPRSLTGLWINGIYRASEMDDPLAPGAELPGVFARYIYRGGDIRVCADYQDRIEEADNDNNCLEEGNND